MPVRYIFAECVSKIIQYVGLCVFSLPISFGMVERIHTLCLVIIIKSEVWTITYCLGLGHETMVYAVCLFIFLYFYTYTMYIYIYAQWRKHIGRYVSNHRRLDCLLKRLFRSRSEKTSKLSVTGLCGGDPPVTGGFPSPRASNAENVSIWWRHHAAHLCISSTLSAQTTSYV